MSSGSYRQADVVCPLYRHDDGKLRITCEGIVDPGSVSFIFGKRADYETQITTFCCAHYARCEIYRMVIEAKYEEE